MKAYEYIKLLFDTGDLSDLNALGSTGWRVVTTEKEGYNLVALLEREIPEPEQQRAQEYYAQREQEKRSRFEST